MANPNITVNWGEVGWIGGAGFAGAVVVVGIVFLCYVYCLRCHACCNVVCHWNVRRRGRRRRHAAAY